jgi:hypothetical protein
MFFMLSPARLLLTSDLVEIYRACSFKHVRECLDSRIILYSGLGSAQSGMNTAEGMHRSIIHRSEAMALMIMSRRPHCEAQIIPSMQAKRGLCPPSQSAESSWR